ncbi:hypothetical protein [Hyphomicrobium sp. DY-1]|uniref:hypothetical protein n=1 Tax=Hyphomicrobium sp. DY-1 TaxID=3075650 RepID=UPI0039C31676
MNAHINSFRDLGWKIEEPDDFARIFSLEPCQHAIRESQRGGVGYEATSVEAEAVLLMDVHEPGQEPALRDAMRKTEDGLVTSLLSLRCRLKEIERIALRQKYGTGFLEATDRDVRDHAWKWFLFQGLSDALQDSFAEDVRDYLEDICAGASARRRRGAT